jgi:NAD(P)-dependent dehydrogenase (short-subunit alcohol dehydrogenase family)
MKQTPGFHPSSPDPREAGPKPPFPPQTQPQPGFDARMEPKADYGEQSYVGCERLAGKKALITGGDSGIGRAIAIAFAREGADVALSYLCEEEDAQETARWVRRAGRQVLTLPGDIQDEPHCKRLVARTVEELGGLDILLNNAAYQMSYDDITQIPPAEIERTFRTNIMAMFYLCQAAIPRMRPGSSIINTASVQSYNPKPSLLPYATTKGAIVTFTQALSQEAVEKGIRVNAAAPGPVWTPLIPASFPPEHVAQFGKSAPRKRAAQPAEPAPVYVFPASNDASFVTGMVYGVTGGSLKA